MARKVITNEGNVAYVSHVLKDGTELDTMEGYVIPYTEKNIPVIKSFFNVCENILRQIEKRNAEKLLQQKSEESTFEDNKIDL